MRHRAYALVLLLTLGGCAATGAHDVRLTSQGVSVRLSADPGVVGERNVLRVRLEDAAHHPVSGARVTVALDMPAMPMHRLPLVLSEEGGGAYVNVNPDFDMGGTWTADVRVATPDGLRPHGSLELTIRD